MNSLALGRDARGWYTLLIGDDDGGVEAWVGERFGGWLLPTARRKQPSRRTPVEVLDAYVPEARVDLRIPLEEGYDHGLGSFQSRFLARMIAVRCHRV